MRLRKRPDTMIVDPSDTVKTLCQERAFAYFKTIEDLLADVKPDRPLDFRPIILKFLWSFC